MAQYQAPHWLQWQWALQRAHQATMPPPPPPPPPPLQPDSSQSEDSESECCDGSGNADAHGLLTPGPSSLRLERSHSAVLAAPRAAAETMDDRLERLRLMLQRSSLFASSRQRQRDCRLADRLRSVIDVEAEVPMTPKSEPLPSFADGQENQVQRRARQGFASLDQVASRLLSPPRPSKKALVKVETEAEMKEETVAAVTKPRRRKRGGRRGGRRRRNSLGVKTLPIEKLKEKIPRWSKVGKKLLKGKGKGKGKGKNKSFPKCRTPSPATMRARKRALPPPIARPAVTITWAPTPRPSSRPRPSSAASVTVRIA